MTALTGLRIIERAARVADEYAGKLLADFGAEVIKIELPGGSATRAMGPFVNGESTVFAWLNTNKKSVVLDPGKAGDHAILHRLLASADALVDGHDAPWREAKSHPHLVHCVITPFGQTAPPAWQQARAINVMSAGGWAWHTPSESAPDSPPLKGPGRFLPDYEAGLEAALCIAASLWRKRQTGKGQFIDISQVGVQLSRADCVIGRMLAGEQEPGPERTRYDMGGPGATFACADGHVFLLMTTSTHWRGLCALMGDPVWAATFPSDWLEFHCTTDRVAEFRMHFSRWATEQHKDSISEAAQKLGVALVQVNTAGDLPRHAQYVHRGFFQTLKGVDYPTVPYHMSGSPVRLTTPAPALGAHSAEVC
jgi:crotonobetainyl-CoA:carnitine CoA-transferase CaiB-like acyl-CoA transferase